MILVAPRAPAVPTVTPRPPAQVVFAVSADLVCSLAGTADRPMILLSPRTIFIYGEPEPEVPFEFGDILAETGDHLTSEAGDGLITEDV